MMQLEDGNEEDVAIRFTRYNLILILCLVHEVLTMKRRVSPLILIKQLIPRMLQPIIKRFELVRPPASMQGIVKVTWAAA